MGVFNKTIIPLALVGYEMIIISYPTRPRGKIVKYSKITELTNSHRIVTVKCVQIPIKRYLLLLKDLPHLEAGEREETDPKNKNKEVVII